MEASTPSQQINPQAPGENTGQPNPAPKKRDPWGRVIGTNLLIFLVYTIIVFATGGNGIVNVLTYIYHAGALLLISLVLAVMGSRDKRSYNASAYFVSAGLLLVIGFGTCFLAFMTSAVDF
jgi:hypothetical protein